MSEGVAINRGLTDDERRLLMDLAARTIADQTTCTVGEANAVLGKLAAQGLLSLEVDAGEVRVAVGDQHVLVTAARDWAAFHAAHPGHDPWGDRAS